MPQAIFKKNNKTKIVIPEALYKDDDNIRLINVINQYGIDNKFENRSFLFSAYLKKARIYHLIDLIHIAKILRYSDGWIQHRAKELGLIKLDKNNS